MSRISFNIRHIWLLFLLFIFLCFGGCKNKEKPKENQPLRDNTPIVHTPKLSGSLVYEKDILSLDCSETSSGYIALTYKGKNEKVKFQIKTPDKVTYTYLVSEYNKPIIFPLTDKSGLYTFVLYEAVDAKEDLYAIVFQQELKVQITDLFLPYLTPNIYTQFTQDCGCVVKSCELALECYCDLDVIENIYLYVTKNITYDQEKAQNVSYGYIPNPDKTLSSKKGICFDYASLMTAMLRSQRIPTKLEVGYAGNVYHAWISCYVKEIGWIDNIIEFDGEHWSLMDPTLAANNNRNEVKDYIGDGSKYIVKYTY